MPLCWSTSRIRQIFAISLVGILAACAEKPSSAPSYVADQLSTVDFNPPQLPHEPVTTEALGQPAARSGVSKQLYLGTDDVTGTRTRGGTARKTADGAQINFENAELSEVARAILGQVLGVSYSIDPSISGIVTIDSGGPLSDRQLIAVLESVLDANGGALVANGAGYKIVPIDRARGRSEVLPLGSSNRNVRAGFGSTIIPLRYISALNAAQFTQPLVHRAEDVQYDDRLNLLIVTGSTSERQNVVDTIADLDVDWMSGKSVGIFPLAVTTPEAMIPELQALFDAGPAFDGMMASRNIDFIPIARLNAILAIAAAPEQIVRADRWITRLDKGKSVNSQFYVYTLKHLPAEEVAKLLSESFNGFVPSSGPGPSDGSPPDQYGTPVLDGDSGLPGVTQDLAPLPNASLGVAAAPAVQTKNTEIKIVANKTNNSLLIRASPQAYEMIEATLRRLDRAPLQVLIEATIAEVTLNDELRYGIQYYLNSGNFQAGFDNSNAAASASSNLIEPLTRLPGFNFLFSPGSSRLLIDALSSLTDVRVLSSPSLVVQDNSTASLTVGDEVPITTRTAVGVQNVNAPVVNNIEYRKTGVILKVKPRINSDQVVSLDIQQEVSRLSDPVDPGLTPTITQRRIESSINVQTGQTVVLGGLIQDTESRGRDQFPILGDIPVLGNLFGGTRNTASRTELIVFIKPRIIRSAEDARDVSEELRARMRAVSPVRPKSRFQPWKSPSAKAEPDATGSDVIKPSQIETGGTETGGIETGGISPDLAAISRTGLDPATDGQPVIPQQSPLRPSRAPHDQAAAPVPLIRPITGDTPLPQIRPSPRLL